jgi:hypothetical protein
MRPPTSIHEKCVYSRGFRVSPSFLGLCTMCSSCGSQIDPKKGKLESGQEITLTLHTQGERWMDGWMDWIGWMSLFPNYFYIDKSSIQGEKEP